MQSVSFGNAAGLKKFLYGGMMVGTLLSTGALAKGVERADKFVSKPQISEVQRSPLEKQSSALLEKPVVDLLKAYQPVLDDYQIDAKELRQLILKARSLKDVKQIFNLIKTKVAQKYGPNSHEVKALNQAYKDTTMLKRPIMLADAGESDERFGTVLGALIGFFVTIILLGIADKLQLVDQDKLDRLWSLDFMILFAAIGGGIGGPLTEPIREQSRERAVLKIQQEQQAREATKLAKQIEANKAVLDRLDSVILFTQQMADSVQNLKHISPEDMQLFKEPAVKLVSYKQGIQRRVVARTVKSTVDWDEAVRIANGQDTSYKAYSNQEIANSPAFSEEVEGINFWKEDLEYGIDLMDATYEKYASYCLNQYLNYVNTGDDTYKTSPEFIDAYKFVKTYKHHVKLLMPSAVAPDTKLEHEVLGEISFEQIDISGIKELENFAREKSEKAKKSMTEKDTNKIKSFPFKKRSKSIFQ